MNSREFQSAAIIKLDNCMDEIRNVKKFAEAIDVKVANIIPQSHLQPLSKPSQKEVGRDLNVASWFRKRISEENAKISGSTQRKYMQFPEHFTDDQLNEDMKRCMHNILCQRLRPGWELKNWNAIYNEDKTLGEQIINEAAHRPEMSVVAQSAGYWAIRALAEQRQISTKRAAEQKQMRARCKKESRSQDPHVDTALQSKAPTASRVSAQDDVQIAEGEEAEISIQISGAAVQQVPDLVNGEDAVNDTIDSDPRDLEEHYPEVSPESKECEKLEVAPRDIEPQVYLKKNLDSVNIQDLLRLIPAEKLKDLVSTAVEDVRNPPPVVEEIPQMQDVDGADVNPKKRDRKKNARAVRAGVNKQRKTRNKK